MSTMILSVLSVIAFCICCRFFIRAVVTPVSGLSKQGGMYKKRSLLVKKSYSIFAWGVMTMSFLVTLVVSFVQVYTAL